MAKSTAFITDYLNHIFQNANIANLGDVTGVRGSTSAGNLYIALHTADPGVGGNQSTNEAGYTGYGRVAVARSGAGWTVSAPTVTNAAQIAFGQCTAAPTTITHVSIGRDTSGAGEILYSGAVGSPFAVSINSIPAFAIGALVVTES